MITNGDYVGRQLKKALEDDAAAGYRKSRNLETRPQMDSTAERACSAKEEVMLRHRALTLLVPFCLLPLLIGGESARPPAQSKPAENTRHQPVLKEDDDAKTILAKAVKACGGKKALSRWNCGYVKYKTKGGVIPARYGEVTLEDTFQLPGHFKRRMSADMGGKEFVMVFVINDGKGWKKRGDEEAEVIDNNRFTSRREHPFASFSNLLPLTQADVHLEKLGFEKVDEQQVVVVRAKSDKLGEVDFYFALKTGFLVKTRKSLPVADSDKPAVIETYLDSYKDVEGGKIPMRIKGMKDGQVILNVTLIEMKFADKFEAGTFAKP